jgi:hypothetical protein
VDAGDFPSRVLLGFAPVELDAGETAEIAVTGSTRPLQRWTPDGFIAAAPVVTLEAAAYSGDRTCATASLPLN